MNFSNFSNDAREFKKLLSRGKRYLSKPSRVIYRSDDSLFDVLELLEYNIMVSLGTVYKSKSSV